MSQMQEYDQSSILPSGIFKFNKPEASNGLIILIGQLFDGEYSYFSGSELDKSMVQATNTNILFINMNNEVISLETLQHEIQDFAVKNDKLTIILAAHGFEIFPWTAHETLFKPQIKDGWADIIGKYAATYLSGHYINSEALLETIGTALANKAVEVWQCSCQGTKLIDAAQKFLPAGSQYITETKGFATRPDLVLNAVNSMLAADEIFSLEKLFLKYAYAITNYDNNAIPNYALNQDPVITTIGQDKTVIAEHADKLLADCKSGYIATADIEKVTSLFCAAQGELQPRCITEVQAIFTKILEQEPHKTISACSTHQGEGAWMVGEIQCFIFGDQCYEGPYQISENCVAANDSEYMLLLGLGFVYNSLMSV